MDAPPGAWVVRLLSEGEDERRISIVSPSA